MAGEQCVPSPFRTTPCSMLKVFQTAVTIIRFHNSGGGGVGSSYTDFALGSVLEVKL
jgi:hypothetical protein